MINAIVPIVPVAAAVNIGLCFSSKCSAYDLNLVLEELFNILKVFNITIDLPLPGGLKLGAVGIKDPNEYPSKGFTYYFTIALIILFVILALTIPCYEVIQNTKSEENDP